MYAHKQPTQPVANNQQTLNGQTPDQSKFATVMVVSLIGMGLFKLWSMGREKAEE